MPKRQERRLEADCRRIAEARGCLFMKFESPGLVGVPDRILILPTGRLVFVELKTWTAPSKVQLYIHRLLTTYKQRVCIIRTTAEFMELIDEQLRK